MALSAKTLRAARRYGPSVDQLAERRYGISGAALLAKVVLGESGDNAHAVSSAGARGKAQFTAGSRATAIQKYGLDPWRSTDEAVHAAALHLRGKINGSKGLEGYNPGDPGYRAYILSQKVGNVGGGQGGDANALLQASSRPAQGVPQGSDGLVPLLASLSAQKQPVASAGVQAPSFSAAPALPAGLQTPVSGGGPQPKPDIGPLLDAIRTTGGDVPSTGGVQSGGSAAGAGSALVASVKAEADHIDQAKVPYAWGGGHGKAQSAGSKVTPLDCSGAVSRVLGVNPRVSGQFEKWGKPGRGAVTVYANARHVLMEIDGHFWGTSKSNPGGGAGWIPRGQISPAYLRQFKARHA